MHKKKEIALQVIFWLFVFIRTNFVQLNTTGLSFNFSLGHKYFSDYFFLIIVGYFTVSMVAFYSSNHFTRKILVRPKAFSSVLYILIPLALIVAYRAILEFGILKPLFHFDNYRSNQDLTWRFFIPNVLFYYWDYFICGIAWALFRHWQNREYQRQEEESLNKTIQLQFLQSQINPHFLFNSINDIYALSLKKSDQTPEALMRLSGLLRYALYDNKEMMVPLEKELTYIQDYLNLQRIGYENNFYVTLQIQVDRFSWNIPPMLLLPFVENACKHGLTDDPDKPVNITLHTNNHTLTFRVINAYEKVQKDLEGGIGLENIKKRMQLLYPDKHKVNIVDLNNSFMVELEINRE